MSRDGRDGRDGKDGKDGERGLDGDPGRPGRDADPQVVASLIANALRELPPPPAPDIVVVPATTPRASWRFQIFRDDFRDVVEMIVTPID